MKSLILTLLCLSATSYAVAASSTALQCGTVSLSISQDKTGGQVLEQGGLPSLLECQDVTGQAGWEPGAVLVCDSVSRAPTGADGVCQPIYTVETYADGRVDIQKDTIGCHSCENFDPVYQGLCK